MEKSEKSLWKKIDGDMTEFFADAGKKAGRHSSFKNMFGLRNDREFTYPAGSGTEKTVLDGFFFGNMLNPSYPANPKRISVNCDEEYAGMLREVMTDGTTAIIRNAFTRDTGSSGENELFGKIADIWNAVPDRFAEQDIMLHLKNLAYRPYAETLDNEIYAFIKWDALFEKPCEPVEWIKNIGEMLQAILPEEKIREYDDSPCRVLQMTADLISSEIPDILRTVNDAVNRLPFKTENTDIAGVSAGLRQYRPDPCRTQYPIPAPEPMDAPDWLIPACVLFDLGKCERMIALRKMLTENFSEAEIMWTVIRTYSNVRKTSILPPVTEQLLISAFMSRITDPVTVNIIRNGNGDDTAGYDTRLFREIPKKWQKKWKRNTAEYACEHDDCPDDLVIPETISLYQIFMFLANVQLPEHLSIPSAPIEMFTDLGFPERDALLLTGYAAGAKEENSLAMLQARLLDIFVEEDEDTENEDVTEDTDTENVTENTEENKTGNTNVLKAEHEKSLQSERAKAAKTEKMLRHELSEKDDETADLKAQIAILTDEINRLENENARLVEYAPDDDQTDDDIPDSGPGWPCTAAENLKILVIGGTPAWIARMSERFPNARFYGTNSIPDNRTIDTCDYLFINTFCLKHKRFWPVANEARKTGITMHMFDTSGANSCSMQIYNTITKTIS